MTTIESLKLAPTRRKHERGEMFALISGQRRDTDRGRGLKGRGECSMSKESQHRLFCGVGNQLQKTNGRAMVRRNTR